MKSLIADFQKQQPSIAVEYIDLNSVPLNKKFLEDYENKATSDLIISSAMDLQIKLVNDGYADTHSTELLQWLPEWAQWRRQAFGFTAEPAVMVYNKKRLTDDDVPQNRFELIELLRDQTQRFKGRIGTYDIQRSGLGYLFASQDAQQASTWGRLTENLNSVKVKLYDSTSQMLNAVRSGELLLSYNVLGSYAFSAVSQSDELGMILWGDYTLAMSRVAFVSNHARNPEAGHQFLDYLLSERGQRLLAVEARLYPIHPQVTGGATLTGLQQATRNRGPLKLIKLGPALLTYQDQMKKENFLNEWRKVIR
jgi:iron(III) transport system substrate-binding protein/two-component system sensor histidine kinase TctE